MSTPTGLWKGPNLTLIIETIPGLSQNWNLVSKNYFSSLSLEFYPQEHISFANSGGRNPWTKKQPIKNVVNKL